MNGQRSPSPVPVLLGVSVLAATVDVCSSKSARKKKSKIAELEARIEVFELKPLKGLAR